MPESLSEIETEILEAVATGSSTYGTAQTRVIGGHVVGVDRTDGELEFRRGVLALREKSLITLPAGGGAAIPEGAEIALTEAGWRLVDGGGGG